MNSLLVLVEAATDTTTDIAKLHLGNTMLQDLPTHNVNNFDDLHLRLFVLNEVDGFSRVLYFFLFLSHIRFITTTRMLALPIFFTFASCIDLVGTDLLNTLRFALLLVNALDQFEIRT